MRNGLRGNKRLSGKKLDKIWLRQELIQTPDGDDLQLVTVYYSQVKGARMVFMDK